MLLLGLIGAICGLLLGRRNSILILVPAHGAALVAAGVAVLAEAAPLATTFVGLLAWSIASQLGFLIAAWLARAPAGGLSRSVVPGQAERSR